MSKEDMMFIKAYIKELRDSAKTNSIKDAQKLANARALERMFVGK